jgi:hypothetical protein
VEGSELTSAHSQAAEKLNSTRSRVLDPLASKPNHVRIRGS